MACDLIDYIMDDGSMRKTGPPPNSRYFLRYSFSKSSKTMQLGVCMSFPGNCLVIPLMLLVNFVVSLFLFALSQFCFFQTVSMGGRYQLKHLTTLSGPQVL
jgi:hypothetical protein